jgi:hypothetical protein
MEKIHVMATGLLGHISGVQLRGIGVAFDLLLYQRGKHPAHSPLALCFSWWR